MREARKARNLTLTKAGEALDLDAGQLSRFERGHWKRGSRNLLKYLQYLQIKFERAAKTEIDLATRAGTIAARSALHKVLLEQILKTLELVPNT